MSKSKKSGNGLATLDETLAAQGLSVVPEQAEGALRDVSLPAWVEEDESVMLPPNLIEELVKAHRDRDAAFAVYQQHENRRGGLFDGFLFAAGLPMTTTYDLATGLATVPKAE